MIRKILDEIKVFFNLPRFWFWGTMIISMPPLVMAFTPVMVAVRSNVEVIMWFLN